MKFEWEALNTYIMKESHMAVALISRRGCILWTNASFDRCMKRAAEGGRPRELQECQRAVLQKAMAGEDSGSRFSFPLKSSGADWLELEACLMRMGEGFLLILERPLTQSEDILKRMSSINNEMAGLSRSLAKKNRELEWAKLSIEKMAHTDPLTRLYNRRYLKDRMKGVMAAYDRRNEGEGLDPRMALILIDLDDFKSVNDIWGHDIGDEVLEKTADSIKTGLREEDVVVRYGGEEFLVMLFACGLDGALEIAERIRKRVELLEFTVKSLKVTGSLGVSEYRAGDTMDTWIKRTDEALYEAKNKGKNRVESEKRRLA